ncbi:unnamed protein product [Prunus armeniaca]|uniref:RanBP2-type domain-containing protein n=1 Tax=Prunus armeniaca TaxID=36596 RepID=A0A6J5TQ93_PRUAR|nr:hypothetical protein GBA52_002406 [Prunus armeniaca]CAB4265225.1 unnamed protein product [Prunus armeniaca]
MYKLLKIGHDNLYPVLRIHFQNPKFLIPISQFHSPSETLAPNPKLDFVVNEVKELQSSKDSKPTYKITQLASGTDDPSDRGSLTNAEDCTVQISHPWREWLELMECLLKRGYFEGDENPFRNAELGPKESNRIRTACLNFARDRCSLIRLLSRKDIQTIAGCGCPSLDRKVVNSGKRLRAHVGINEGDVCSSCNLRGDCERAYVKAREDEGGRTVDVMRFLLTYGLDPITGTVENKPCLNQMVKESVRRLLKEMVDYSNENLDSNLPKSTSTTMKRVASVPNHSISQEKLQINVPMKQGDWLCPKCNFLNFARNIKCLRCDELSEERLAKLREDQDHLPLKKGDWICDKCNFLNFAKNGRCLQCKEKPPKRHINPGEWECDSCNYINFRRNMVCLKCDHKRPKGAHSSEPSAEPVCEDGGCPNNNSMNFVGGDSDVNDQSYAGQCRQSQDRGVGMWRFVDEGDDDGSHSKSWNEASGFVDFPIAGGKTELSRNLQKRDKWKLKMLERSKGGMRDMANDDGSRSASIPRSLELSDCTDDEEMSDWFGDGKLETASALSEPKKFGF